MQRSKGLQFIFAIASPDKQTLAFFHSRQTYALETQRNQKSREGTNKFHILRKTAELGCVCLLLSQFFVVAYHLYF